MLTINVVMTAVWYGPLQEVITLLVFCMFSVVYLEEELKWNYIVDFLLIAGAVFFVFKKW